jgi:tRNA A37 N6-isopentenylltransferase MiaA
MANETATTTKIEPRDFSTLNPKQLRNRIGQATRRYARAQQSWLESCRELAEVQNELFGLHMHLGAGTTATASEASAHGVRGSKAPKERVEEPVGAGAETG